ncbi:MAG TPA: ATP-dependent DNA helicase [Candidatus Sulfotelmatobacter sp.]|nr:ATP-dependent DNA helicase [Candidatus Sulfotelmatobacter sp.]
MPSAKSNSRSTPFTPDDRQRAAIEHVHGPMLVVAGAGTGKTSVLTHRIEYLVGEGHARPDEILALTYTVNAATEMKERVQKLLGGKVVQAHTFHDYCLKLLQSVHRDFGVLDEKDLWIYLRRRMRELRLEYYIRAANVPQFLNDLLEFVSRCHDELVTPEKYAQYVERLERKEVPIPRVLKSKNVLDEAEVLGRCREIARVFSSMERWLQEENLGTFSHMITRAHDLLAADESVLAQARARARFILADEFQDANFAQIKILARLAGSTGNIFAVGDPDQSIYRFRGASSAAFQLFHRSFPDPKLVVLDKNRRSTTPILRTAFALIDKNPPVFSQQAGSTLQYARAPLQSAREEEARRAGTQLPSPVVEAVILACKDTEGPDLVAYLHDARAKARCKWSDFGVLYRSHGHRDDLVQELAGAGIPFVIESMDISDTSEARDLFACLHAVVSSGDDVSLFRVAGLPCFHVNPEQLRQVMRAIARDNREAQVVPLSSALDRVAGGADVLAAVRDAREEIQRRNAKARAALDIIVREFALDAASPIIQGALQFVADWEKKKINKTTELHELVEYLGYFREAGGVIPLPASQNENAVRLMTVHGAKGLEFPHVFILRATSNSFPSPYKESLVAFPRELRDPDSLTEAEDKMLHGQEERRLFYVAMTRARDSLHIYAREGTGRNDKTPPGYIRELIANRAVAPWFRAIPARGSQATLDIAAGGSTIYPAESQTTAWFQLPVLPGLHKRLSASAVDTYERCGLQFKLDRDWRIPAQPAAAMQYGAAIHRVLKTYFDAARLGRPKTTEELLDLFRVDLAAANLQESYQRELYEQQGTAQLTDFLTSARQISASQVLHTEESFEIHLGETIVVGRIDRIDSRPDGTVAIVDYKTGKARDQEDADESLQLSLYAIAAHEKWGYKVGALIFHNLEENVPVFTLRSDAQLLDARERVRDAARGIADGIFEAHPGNHCNFCAYRSLCPEKEKRIPHPAEANVARSN